MLQNLLKNIQFLTFTFVCSVKNHVSRNKEERKSVREGVKTAKQTYLEEVRNAGILADVAEM